MTSVSTSKTYEEDRIRLEKMLDDKKHPMFELGRQKGAIDFCSFLRGKVDANALLIAWENFTASQSFL